jgi:DNA-binding TFAR19-related protein (PDSD5 family)
MNKIFSNLRSIGISFTAKNIDFKKEIITPEDALLSALPIIKADNLTLELLYTWLKKNAELIHAESLQKKIESENEPVHLAFLAALLTYSEDRRLVTLASKIRFSKKDINDQIDKTLRLAAQFGQVEYDPVFQKFGIKISKLYEEDEKKFIPKEYAVQDNPFLFCRALFGTNWRADVAAVMSLRNGNPTEIANILGCSYETAHRNYQSLKSAGWPSINLEHLHKQAPAKLAEVE